MYPCWFSGVLSPWRASLIYRCPLPPIPLLGCFSSKGEHGWPHCLPGVHASLLDLMDPGIPLALLGLPKLIQHHKALRKIPFHHGEVTPTTSRLNEGVEPFIPNTNSHAEWIAFAGQAISSKGERKLQNWQIFCRVHVWCERTTNPLHLLSPYLDSSLMWFIPLQLCRP